MSYRRTWSKTFSSLDFNDPEVPLLWKAPERCPEHINKCLRCAMAWSDLRAAAGTWKLRTPINVPTTMPGTKQKVLTVTTQGLYRLGMATWVSMSNSKIMLYDGTTEIWSYSGLSHGDNKWTPNPLNVNLLIDNITSLDVVLYQEVKAETGAIENHDADITISCEYYTETPPSKGDLEITVIDADKRTPLPTANVRILSGASVVRDGYTNSQGKVAFTSIDEGDYVLRVVGVPPSYWSKGYEGIDLAIAVVAGTLSAYTVEMVPLLPLPIPWYAYAGVGFVTVLGLVWLVKPRVQPYIQPIIIRAGEVGHRVKEWREGE